MGPIRAATRPSRGDDRRRKCRGSSRNPRQDCAAIVRRCRPDRSRSMGFPVRLEPCEKVLHGRAQVERTPPCLVIPHALSLALPLSARADRHCHRSWGTHHAAAGGAAPPGPQEQGRRMDHAKGADAAFLAIRHALPLAPPPCGEGGPPLVPPHCGEGGPPLVPPHCGEGGPPLVPPHCGEGGPPWFRSMKLAGRSRSRAARSRGTARRWRFIWVRVPASVP